MQTVQVIHRYRHRAGGDAVVTRTPAPCLTCAVQDRCSAFGNLPVASRFSRVIIDLGRTLRIQDSGLAILLSLKRCLNSRLCEIRLINRFDAMRNRLALPPADFIID